MAKINKTFSLVDTSKLIFFAGYLPLEFKNGLPASNPIKLPKELIDLQIKLNLKKPLPFILGSFAGLLNNNILGFSLSSKLSLGYNFVSYSSNAVSVSNSAEEIDVEKKTTTNLPINKIQQEKTYTFSRKITTTTELEYIALNTLTELLKSYILCEEKEPAYVVNNSLPLDKNKIRQAYYYSYRNRISIYDISFKNPSLTAINWYPIAFNSTFDATGDEVFSITLSNVLKDFDTTQDSKNNLNLFGAI